MKRGMGWWLGAWFVLSVALTAASLRSLPPEQFGEAVLLGAAGMTGALVGVAALILVGEWQDWLGVLGALGFVAFIGYCDGLFEGV